jgi:hypothetical protein
MYAFGKVLEVHAGDAVAVKQSGSECKLDSA